MVLFNVQIQKPVGWEILAALRASVDVGLQVVNFVVVIRREREGLSMRRQGTTHHFDCSAAGGVQERKFGAAERGGGRGRGGGF